jgi:murein L,D-transpeptidase YafK
MIKWFCFFIVFSFSFFADSFRDAQIRYPRVRQAYFEKEQEITHHLSRYSIDKDKLRIYLRAFKTEKKIEVWAKNARDDTFQLVKQFDICKISGETGPKRRQFDLQTPEGFYHINLFNPTSNYFLSLGINYPNKSDRILGDPENPGDAIFIHGGCATIGCLPVTDEKIKELYVYCVEARSSGQEKIPVTIFPAELSDANFADLRLRYPNDTNNLNLWTELKKGYDQFNKTKKLPGIRFLSNGRHEVSH